MQSKSLKVCRSLHSPSPRTPLPTRAEAKKHGGDALAVHTSVSCLAVGKLAKVYSPSHRYTSQTLPMAGTGNEGNLGHHAIRFDPTKSTVAAFSLDLGWRHGLRVHEAQGCNQTPVLMRVGVGGAATAMKRDENQNQGTNTRLAACGTGVLLLARRT